MKCDDINKVGRRLQEHALTCEWWEANTAANGKNSRSYFYVQNTKGNNFPRGGLRSEVNLSFMSLGVSSAHPAS